MFKRILLLTTMSLSLVSFTSCGEANLTGTTTSGITASGSFSELFLAMSPEQQNMFARATSSTELQQLAADPTNATYIAAVDALATSRPELLTMLQNPGQGAGGMPPGGAGGMPPGDMGMGGMPGGMPGGLPPNAEELRIEYPEFIAALEAMQDLDPEARRTAMDALFAEHPEWQELMRPQGGPQGMPPGGDPMAQPAAQASAAPVTTAA